MKIILESMEDIKEFKELIGEGCKEIKVETTVEPKKETKKKASTKKETKEEPKVEEEKEEPKTEKVEAEKVAVDETPTETIQAEVKITKEEVQNACKEKIKAGKTAEVKAIIKAHGATNVSGIKEEDYASVIAEVEAL